MRYTITRAQDDMGQRYLGGPITLCDTDNLAEALAVVRRYGGELIDHQIRTAFSPLLGWYDVSDYLSTLNR